MLGHIKILWKDSVFVEIGTYFYCAILMNRKSPRAWTLPIAIATVCKFDGRSQPNSACWYSYLQEKRNRQCPSRTTFKCLHTFFLCVSFFPDLFQIFNNAFLHFMTFRRINYEIRRKSHSIFLRVFCSFVRISNTKYFSFIKGTKMDSVPSQSLTFYRFLYISKPIF